MKNILIAIRPQWVEKITSGKKTIEVRKTAPQEVPFKAYIYESRNGGHRCKHCNEKDSCYSYAPKNVGCYNGSGKVIGEFICDRIDEYKYVYCDHPEIGYPVGYDCGDNWYDIDDEDLQKACLTEEEFKRYCNGKPLYGWHISDLKIYDRPRNLSEFRKSGFMTEEEWLFNLYPNTHCHYEAWAKKFEITRPPQSWMYIEDLGD